MRENFVPLVWSKHYTKVVVVYTILLFVAFIFFYRDQMVHPIWIAFTLFIVFWYFITLTQYSAWWQWYSDEKFQKKLFWHSFGYRLVTGLIIMVVSQATWDSPVYVGAVDAKTYHQIAIQAAEQFSRFNFVEGFNLTHLGEIDNSGPGVFYGILYIFTGGFYTSSIIFGSLIGALSVVYLYKTARIIWGEAIGRASGLMYMHFPLALFYSTVTLKEGIVAVFIIIIAYIITRAINKMNLTLAHLLVLIASLISLFLFRTAVGLGCLMLVTTAFLVNRYRGSFIVSIFIGLFSVGAFFWVMYSIGEIEYFIQEAGTATTVGQQRTIELLGSDEIDIIGVSITDLALFPIYIIAAVFAPFPGFVEVGTVFNTPFDHNYMNAPGRLIWNVLAYFSVIGFWYAIRDKLMNSLFVWGFSAGYLLILIITVTFTRERFAFLGMPLLLILATVGIYRTRSNTLWYIYLCGLLAVVIFWNYLRLSTRGLF